MNLGSPRPLSPEVSLNVCSAAAAFSRLAVSVRCNAPASCNPKSLERLPAPRSGFTSLCFAIVLLTWIACCSRPWVLRDSDAPYRSLPADSSPKDPILLPKEEKAAAVEAKKPSVSPTLLLTACDNASSSVPRESVENPPTVSALSLAREASIPLSTPVTCRCRAMSILFICAAVLTVAPSKSSRASLNPLTEFDTSTVLLNSLWAKTPSFHPLIAPLIAPPKAKRAPTTGPPTRNPAANPSIAPSAAPPAAFPLAAVLSLTALPLASIAPVMPFPDWASCLVSASPLNQSTTLLMAFPIGAATREATMAANPPFMLFANLAPPFRAVPNLVAVFDAAVSLVEFFATCVVIPSRALLALLSWVSELFRLAVAFFKFVVAALPAAVPLLPPWIGLIWALCSAELDLTLLRLVVSWATWAWRRATLAVCLTWCCTDLVYVAWATSASLRVLAALTRNWPIFPITGIWDLVLLTKSFTLFDKFLKDLASRDLKALAMCLVSMPIWAKANATVEAVLTMPSNDSGTSPNACRAKPAPATWPPAPNFWIAAPLTLPPLANFWGFCLFISSRLLRPMLLTASGLKTNSPGVSRDGTESTTPPAANLAGFNLILLAPNSFTAFPTAEVTESLLLLTLTSFGSLNPWPNNCL